MLKTHVWTSATHTACYMHQQQLATCTSNFQTAYVEMTASHSYSPLKMGGTCVSCCGYPKGTYMYSVQCMQNAILCWTKGSSKRPRKWTKWKSNFQPHTQLHISTCTCSYQQTCSSLLCMCMHECTIIVWKASVQMRVCYTLETVLRL